MAKYKVRLGYCLHLPNQMFAEFGAEVELVGDLEQEVLTNQGWKIEPAQAEPDKEKTKEVIEPPKDRIIKKARTK